MKIKFGFRLSNRITNVLVVMALMACMQVVIQVSVSGAAPAMLNNGQEIDIPKQRLQGLKDSAGIFFFPYRPENIFKNKINEWVIIKLFFSQRQEFL